MPAPRIRLELLDQYAHQVGTVNGSRVTGALAGYRNLRFIARGAIMDEGESCSFDLPMTLRQNYPLTPGTAVRVVDPRFAGEQGTYYVDEKSETVSEDGHWASFTLGGLVEELCWETVPGLAAFAGEPTEGTLGRLLAIPFDTPWTYKHVDTVDSFRGLKFVAEDVSVQQATDKIIRDRLMHWRRGDGRVIEYGVFRRKTGIRLVEPSPRPADMDRPHIRPIPPGGIRNVEDAAGIANCLPVTGTGDGWARLTLQPLYNPVGETKVPGTNWWVSGPPVPWVGMDPRYPVYRRTRYDGGGSDGWQYFLTDPGSVAKYRKRWLPYPRQDIGPIDNGNPNDRREAAAWLYQAGVVYLQNFSKLHGAISVTADGRGDNRGIAGDTVRVEYGTLTINDDRVVVSVERAVDDATGACTDTFALSDIGRAVLDDTAVTTGILESIQQIRTGPMIYPIERDIHRDQPINAQNPVTITLNLHAGVQQVVEATFSIQLLPVYSTLTGGDVDEHFHDVPVPALSIDASVPYTNESASNPGGQFYHGHTSGSVQGSGYNPFTSPGKVNHGHTDSITATKSGTSANYSTVDDITTGIRNHNHTMLVVGGGAPSSLGDRVLYIRDNPYHLQTAGPQGQLQTDYPGFWTATGNHNHADSIGVGKAGSVNGGYPPGGWNADTADPGLRPSVDPPNFGWTPDSRFPGYSNLQTRAATTQSSGPKKPGWTPKYGVFKDPAGKPSNVTFSIGGKVVAGPFNADATGIRLAQYVTGQEPVTITITSDTLGRVVVDGFVRASVSTYKVG